MSRGWGGADFDIAAYHAAWAPLNRPLIDAALARLPALPDGAPDPAVIHVPGAGSGLELPGLRQRYPDARLLASDLTGRFLDLPASDPGLRDGAIPFLRADITAPPLRDLAMTVSCFVLHLCGDPLRAMQQSLRSLAPGGVLAALYFPPIPGEPGPLTSLFTVVRSMTGRDKPDWEADVQAWLQPRADEVQRLTLRHRWWVVNPAAMRAALESLPHIAALRSRAREGFYTEMWRRWEDDPGLQREPDGGRWSGEVAARLLIARRPVGSGSRPA